jgi:hypothetical protein
VERAEDPDVAVLLLDDRGVRAAPRGDQPRTIPSTPASSRIQPTVVVATTSSMEDVMNMLYIY